MLVFNRGGKIIVRHSSPPQTHSRFEGFAPGLCLLTLTATRFLDGNPQQIPCILLVKWISQIERCPKDAPRCRRKYRLAPQLLNLALQYHAAATRCLPAKGCQCRT